MEIHTIYIYISPSNVKTRHNSHYKRKSVWTIAVYGISHKTCAQFRRASLQWRHNEHNGVSDHQPHDCLFNRLFSRRSKKTSKLRVTDLCVGNSPVTGEFPEQRASNAENVSIWWRHHVLCSYIVISQSLLVGFFPDIPLFNIMISPVPVK